MEVIVIIINADCISLFFSFFYHSLVFALYMSIRIRSENLTQQMLTQELSNGVPVANAVPASGYQKIPELAGEATIV